MAHRLQVLGNGEQLMIPAHVVNDAVMKFAPRRSLADFAARTTLALDVPPDCHPVNCHAILLREPCSLRITRRLPEADTRTILRFWAGDEALVPLLGRVFHGNAVNDGHEYRLDGRNQEQNIVARLG